MVSTNKMIRYNKYAMPVDPRVLKKDYESQGLDTIPELISLLKSIRSVEEYEAVDHIVRTQISDLWFLTNKGQGINLRDREKLLPVFQELSRIFKKKELLTSRVYRGVALPKIYKNLLTKSFIGDINAEREVNLHSHPKVIQKLEYLAYGLRSWTKYFDIANEWSYGTEEQDSIIFEAPSKFAVLDCNSYFNTMWEKIASSKIERLPFDFDEVICHLDNPKVSYIKMLEEKGINTNYWLVGIR
ncbi:hypothetical protein EB001_12340 [bacterium]|nr:hypothetical protein [bacterium]